MENKRPGSGSKHPGRGLTNAIQQLVYVSNTRCVFLFVSGTVKCGVALFRKQLMKIKKEKAKEVVKEGGATLEGKLGAKQQKRARLHWMPSLEVGLLLLLFAFTQVI